MNDKKFKATRTHAGQYKPYGDSFNEWDILTDATQEETVEWCFSNLYKRRVPPSAEWHANIRTGGKMSGDYGYYFAGYYDIKPIPGGFHFTICEPYAD